jgi:hypothetical protein
MLAITYTKITKIKGAKWGTSKKVLKKFQKKSFEGNIVIVKWKPLNVMTVSVIIRFIWSN